MKLYLTFFLCILFCSCNQNPTPQKKVEETRFHKEFQRGPLKIDISFSPEKPSIADRILLDIVVTADVQYAVQMPDFANNIGQIFYVYSFFPDQEKVKNSKKIFKQHYELEALLSGKTVIPPIEILYQKGKEVEKNSSYKAVTDAIEIEIESIDVDKEKQGIYDIQNVMPLHYSNFYLLVIGAALGCVILITFLVVMFFPKAKEKEIIDTRTPEEIAWEKLKELMDKQLIENHLYQQFYFELTMIVRQYIEIKYNIKASGQTTEEFLNDLQKSQVFDSKRKQDFHEFLQATDFVKYAAQDPQEKEVVAVFDAAKKFMNLE